MIEILNKQKKFWVNCKKFLDLLQKLVRHYRQKDSQIVLVFAGNSEIKKLNKKFLKKNAATDVLSFPLQEKASDGNFYLGDIIISVPRAFQQCLNEDHGLERELEILTIHGFLHLLGFDHGTGIEEEQEKITRLLLQD